MFPFREDRLTLLLLLGAVVGYFLTYWYGFWSVAAVLVGYFYGRRSAFHQVDKAHFEKAYPGEKWED